MSKNKIIILSLLVVIGLIFVSTTHAAVTKTTKSNLLTNDMQSKAGSNVINLGNMKIQDKECKIDIKYDNIVPIKDVSPYDTYAFSIQYYFREVSINQEKWVFRMSMQTGTNGEKTLIQEKIIEDDWALTDLADGELWVEVPGYKLWESREYNYITLDCEVYSDIAWLSNLELVDESHEMTQVTVNNYLAPELNLKALDGKDFGKVGIKLNYPRKVFIVENEGSWLAKNVSFELLGHPEFKIVAGPEGLFDLAAGEQKQITIEYKPVTRGDKTALLRAHDGDFIFSSKEITLKGFSRIPNAKGKAVQLNLINEIFEKLFSIF